MHILASAQPFDQPLHLPKGTLTLQVVMDVVKTQFGYQVHYDGGIPLNRPIKRPGNTQTDCRLKNILDKLDLHFIVVDSVVDKIITIKKKHPRDQPPALLANTSENPGPASQQNDKNDLQAAIVTGYATGNRLNYTGDRAQITGPDLYCTPGTDALGNLEGRLPGLAITQSSGIPGASFGVTLRGRVSILNGRDPLIIVDGVPFAPNDQSLSYVQVGSAAGSLSPFSFLELTDIEKIEVLKDADATAIYGSRGANGVILIATRRGKKAKPRFSLDVTMGANQTTQRPTLMNTRQYTQMRLEALRNDGIKPTAANAPDLTVWDTTHSHNWGNWLIGQPALTKQLYASLIGGDANTHYYARVGGLQEKNVFPMQPTHDLLCWQGSLDHYSKRWTIQLSTLADEDWNHQVIADPTQWQFLAPNAPALVQADTLVFLQSGVRLSNPISFLRQPYKAVSHNLLGDVTISYRPTRRLAITANTGYNTIGVHEVSEIPIASLPSFDPPRGSSWFAFTNYKSSIAELQLEYKKDSGLFHYSVLGGATWQQQNSSTRLLADTGITNDARLDNPGLAYNKPGTIQSTEYNYKALFARATANWDNTVILNLTGRRDGSDRFGPGKQYGNFWAAGFAWVFRNQLPENDFSIISLGKLHASYGITGNDQIGTYNNLSPTATLPFQGIPAYQIALNSGQTWETIRKTEIGMDWGFLNNRFILNAAWYLNRMDHQLLPDSFPNIGPMTIFSNVAIASEARGWELTITAYNIDRPGLQWITSFNLSFPTDKLVNMPASLQSSYGSLVAGKSLNVYKAFRYLGVDPDSGLFRFPEVTQNGHTQPAPPAAVGSLDITCLGGINNTIRWRSWQLDCFVEGRAQTGKNYEAAIYFNNHPGAYSPGGITNQTTALLDRWQHPGDKSAYQLLTTLPASTAGRLIPLYLASSGILTNVSYVRVKELCIAKTWSAAQVKKLHLAGLRWFVQAQNLFTFTPYKGVDPEIQSALIMPPMRTIVTGVHLDY